MVTTLLCMLPPCSGCGWQMMAVPCRTHFASGTLVMASIAPALAGNTSAVDGSAGNCEGQEEEAGMLTS
jgi:hypothetical protein